MRRSKKKLINLTPKERAHRAEVLNALIAGQPLYIKNTGIEVEVTDFNRWFRSGRAKKQFSIDVVIKGTPTIEALDKMRSYSIDRRENGAGGMNLKCNGEVSIMTLSIHKFDTTASRILHGRK
jgi:hypothetical protein